jgi:hypothetical protein
MKSTIFWDMTPCSPLSFNRRFGGIYRLHLHGRRNKFSKNQQTSRCPVIVSTSAGHVDLIMTELVSRRIQNNKAEFLEEEKNKT